MLPKLVGCMTFVVLVTASVGAVVAQANGSPEALQETLLAQETKLLNAIEAHDRPALDKLLADQAIAVTVERGRKMTTDHIAAVASLSVKSYKMSEAKTIPVTPDVAVLSFKLSWTDVGGEEPAMRTVYATVVWKHVGGQWRSVFYQETPNAN